MKGVDEVHLLNLTVAPDYQGQGWGRVMLDALALWSRGQGAQWLWLEVRVSNARAQRIYERHGFRRVGERKNYYPAAQRPARRRGRDEPEAMSLQLDARQRAMLGEMGLRLFAPAAAGTRAAAPQRRQRRGPCSRPCPRRPPSRRLAPGPGAAGSGAIELMEWDALAQAVAECRACRLCAGRTQHRVRRRRPARPDWLIVGEAPGENEDLQGEPFVGQAGKLLDNMLKALGLDRRSKVYIANVLKCRPPGNRNPEPEEVAQCEPFLRRQVQLLQPEVILAMGRFAVQALLRTSEPIGKLRGRAHHYHGVPVVVTYHPAYLLRNLPDKAKAWADLCLAQAADARISR